MGPVVREVSNRRFKAMRPQLRANRLMMRNRDDAANIENALMTSVATESNCVGSPLTISRSAPARTAVGTM